MKTAQITATLMLLALTACNNASQWDNVYNNVRASHVEVTPLDD